MGSTVDHWERRSVPDIMRIIGYMPGDLANVGHTRDLAGSRDLVDPRIDPPVSWPLDLHPAAKLAVDQLLAEEDSEAHFGMEWPDGLTQH